VTTTCLFLDDDPLVLRSVARTCRDQTYASVFFSSPSAALEYLAHHKVDVIVSDFVMPELNGGGFLRRARALAPAARRIVLTGYAPTGVASHAVADGTIEALLSKPFVAAELLDSIARALDGAVSLSGS
jgi:CheY-like chemotaxis protein